MRHDVRRGFILERLGDIKSMQRGISDTFKARNVLDDFDAKRDESRVPTKKRETTSSGSPMVLRRRKMA
jgi:hypothetical protein